MKRLFLYSLLLQISLIAAAQTIVPHNLSLGSAYDYSLSIPKEFTYGGVPLLTMYDEENKNVQIYDEDIQLIRTIDTSQEKSFDYQLTFQDEEREVKAVEVINEDFTLLGMNFHDWVEQIKRTDPNFTEDKLAIRTETNGDSLIMVDLENPYSSVETMYFNYKYFGKQYPRRYWRCRNGQMYQYDATYLATYTDWHTAGTHVEQRQEPLRCIKLCDLNLNFGDERATTYFEVSQTLFNEDEEFEYIIPKYVLAEEGFGGYTLMEPNEDNYGDEPIVTKRSNIASEKSKLALAGFQIVSADGTVTNDLTFERNLTAYDDKVFVISIGNKTYLAFSGYQNDKSCTIFYLVDKKTSSIKRHNIAPAALVAHPTIADKSEQITVELSEESRIHELSIVNSGGQTVKRIPVAPGQRQITIPATHLSTGMNIVHAKGAQGRNACKIIIK